MWRVVAASLVVGALRWLARARVADDYDSIGFVRGVARFDMAALQPHFPGYPVYIALGHALTWIGSTPLTAATLGSSLAAAATAAAVWRLGFVVAERAAKPARAGAWAALALYAAAWLPWMLGGAALSDATATAFVTIAFALATVDGAVAAALAGAAIALAIGTRVSYWPLALSFAILVRRRAALAGAVAATIAWLAPLVALVGAHELVRLGRTHLYGHFTTWGGSIATQSSVPLRLFAFARALVYDGLFAHWAALVVAAPLIAWSLVALWRSAPSQSPVRRAALVVALPYAAWVFVAQNVVEQPRHLLPLVTFACVAFAVALSQRRAAAIAVVALALAASAPLAWTRAHTPPAGAQAAAWVAARFPQPNGAAVFGGRSLRFFETLAPSAVTRTRTWLSEVDVELERLDVLPKHLWITSEVEVDASRARRIGDGPTFCRDARIDRAQPCLSLRAYHLAGR